LLLPTFEEFQDASDSPNLFPQFGDLVRAADDFGNKYCDDVMIDGQVFSAFRRTKAGMPER
jgi:hypothetical protein